MAGLAATASARDRGADGKFEKRESSHFVLYQDVDIDESGGLRGSRRFEQQVLDELERAYDRLDQMLGLRPERRIDVIVYDQSVFDQQFAGRFRFAAAGFYNGVIAIRGDVVVSTQLARVLHHELVHAAFDAASPSLILPAWMNEGIAEWFEARAVSKRHLSPGERGYLQRASNAGALLSIDALSRPNFAGLGSDAASLAYLQSYGMITWLSQNFGEKSLARFIEVVLRSRSIDRAMSRIYRMSVYDLEDRFMAEFS
ncbi:MAG: peptidase MA family metallohydrolase [Myxococcota bacterium]